jgi:hypothetical protein
MRVLFETEPVRAIQRGMPEVEGWAKFVALIFEPNEEIPKHEHPSPISEWRTTLRPDGALVTSAPFEGPEPAVIPSEALAALRDDQLLTIGWELLYDRCIPASEFPHIGSSAGSSSARTR